MGEKTVQTHGKRLADAAEADDQTAAAAERDGKTLHRELDGTLGGRDGVACGQRRRLHVIGENDGVLRECFRRRVERPAEDDRSRRQAFQHGDERNGARLGADPKLLCQRGHRQRDGPCMAERRVQPGTAVGQAGHLTRLDGEAACHQPRGQIALACVAAEHSDRFEHGHTFLSAILYAAGAGGAQQRGKKRPCPGGQGKKVLGIVYLYRKRISVLNPRTIASNSRRRQHSRRQAPYTTRRECWHGGPRSSSMPLRRPRAWNSP